jgi:PAS domain S-box-containing protein
MADMQPRRTAPLFFKSLTFKVGFLAVLIMAVVLIIFSAVFILSERQKAQQSILENGKTFANFSAESIYDQYVQFYQQPLPEDFVDFKIRVEQILNFNKDVEEVSLLSLSGRVLFESKELKEGKYSGPLRTIENEATLEAVTRGETTTRDIIDPKTGELSTEIVVPLTEPTGGHVFSMRYILSYKLLSEHLEQAYQRVFLIATLLLVFVVLISTLLSMRLTRPIVRLIRVAEQIRGGNLGARAEVTGDDEIGHLALTLNDMTDRMRSYYQDLEAKVNERTRELQANVNRDDALLTSIGDGVIATDQTGKIVLFNKVSEELLEMKRDVALGKPYEEIWKLETEKGEQIPTEDHPIHKALHDAQTINDSNYYYARRDGAGNPIVRFPVAITASPVSLSAQVIGMIIVFRNITREKQVDRMKTEFISLASHQLRTPLSAIKWFTEMLLSGDAGELKPEQAEFAKNISDSSERMIALVNSLLNISRIESGRIIVEPKPTDLSELVGGIINDLKAKTEERQQTLVVSVHKDLPKINLDPRLIGQVYLNLLTNAIKYTPKGGEISVFISRNGDQVVSQVTDNGYGIPESEQSKMFGKFFRATNIIKVETDGTGLGMYLVKAIIESSGGKIWFKSAEGKGTTFWFSLPLSGMKAKEGEVTLDV